MAKVVHITSAHPANDMRIFKKEAVSLAAAGHDVTLIARYGSDGIVGNVKMKALPESKGRLRRFLSVWRPIKLAMAERADIYHFHDPELILPVIALKLMTGAKTIYDVHENVPKSILSKFWIPAALRPPVAAVAGLVEKLGASIVDGIVAATPSIAQRFPADKTVLVQNMPITGELDSADPIPYHERGRLVAYVGSITIIRGINEIVRALELLPESLGVRLMMAGEFSPLKLERQVRTLDGFKSVDFLGRRDRREIGELLNKSRIGLVLLHPEPNHIEAQPNKLFEYMSAGIPVIASDFPLWREIISETGCGLVVDPLDPQAIADAIVDLLRDPDGAAAMGARGRQATHSRYSWAQEAGKLVDLYARLSR